MGKEQQLKGKVTSDRPLEQDDILALRTRFMAQGLPALSMSIAEGDIEIKSAKALNYAVVDESLQDSPYKFVPEGSREKDAYKVTTQEFSERGRTLAREFRKLYGTDPELIIDPAHLDAALTAAFLKENPGYLNLERLAGSEDNHIRAAISALKGSVLESSLTPILENALRGFQGELSTRLHEFYVQLQVYVKEGKRMYKGWLAEGGTKLVRRGATPRIPIIQSYNEARRRDPPVQEPTTTTTTTTTKSISSIEEDGKRVVAFVREKGSADGNEIMGHFGWSKGEWGSRRKSAKNQGLVQHRERKQAFYTAEAEEEQLGPPNGSLVEPQELPPTDEVVETQAPIRQMRTGLEEQLDSVRQLMNQNSQEGISTGDIMRLLGVGRDTAQRRAKTLVENSEARPDGNAGGRRYFPVAQ